MKRSEINAIMRSADAFIRQHGFYLPPFAYWTPEDWAEKGLEAAEIVDNQMGWDITDYGQGDFDKIGLFLFTIRNGNQRSLKTGQGKLYAEKLLISGDGQVTPMHFHWNKMEDIINRGGGQLLIQLYNSTPDEKIDHESQVHVVMDGVAHTFHAGFIVALKPGESITLTPGLYHKFWGADGRILVGEVSLVNDDFSDNNFNPPVGRFPQIEEDEPPMYLLIGDYPKYYGSWDALQQAQGK
ncbi:MAG TPA: D-lyxose/D-mannose family sugar isomerase [Anaerolineaceae bacterium]